MIRKFEISDIERILEIEEQCFPKTPFSKTEFLYYYRYHPDSFLVYENDSEIKGYIIFKNNSVKSVAVMPEYRRKSIGTRLMNETIKRNKKIFLEVRESNLVARNFYKKLGFKDIRILPNYYGTEDAYQMALEN